MTWTTTRSEKNVVNANLLGMKKESKREDYHFEIFKGYKENKEIIEPKVYGIKGKLVKVVAGSYDYTDETGKVKKNKTLTFILDDGENEIRYGTGYNTVSRNIIYNLASVEGKIGEIELSPYWSKKGYRNMWVKNNGQDVMNKFDWEKDIKSKCEYSEDFDKWNYKKLDEWIDTKLIPEINNNIDFANKDIEDIVEKPHMNDEEARQELLDNDDLPF